MKINSRRRKENIRLDSVIFLGFVIALMFALFYLGGDITGAAVLTPPVEDNLLPCKSLDMLGDEVSGTLEIPISMETQGDQGECSSLPSEIPREEVGLLPEETITTPMIVPPEESVEEVLSTSLPSPSIDDLTEEITPKETTIMPIIKGPINDTVANETEFVDNVSENTSEIVDLGGTFGIMAPVIDTVTLNSTLGTNLTTENLTAYWTFETDNATKNITNWKTDAYSNELLVDWNMETAGVGDWTAANNGNLTKQTTNPYRGSQVIRVRRDGTNNPIARQVILTAAKQYHVTGWARSDGSATPTFSTAGVAHWTGSTSTNWQHFDEVITADTTSFQLRCATTTGTEYCEFDDVSVKEMISETVLHMPFEGGSSSDNQSTIGDYSGFENNGTNWNNITWSAISGYDGAGAYTFDGDDDYIQIAEDDTLDMMDHDLSVSFWINASVTDTNDFILFKGAGSAAVVGYNLRLSATTGKLLLRIANGSGTYVLDTDLWSTNAEINDSLWHHVVWVWDRDVGNYYYIDGVLDNSETSTNTEILDNANNLLIGGHTSAALTMNGTLDDFMFFNRSLTPEQIQALYENRTDMMTASETSPADAWQSCITPNNGTLDGSEACSSTLTIQSAPVISNMVLNSTLGTNLTTENLTVYWDPTDADNDDVKNITNWKTDAYSSEGLVDGDMETADTSAWTAGNNANLTKQTTSPHGGSQLLRVQYDGTNNPKITQTILAVGKTYRVTGWTRSDGTSVSRIYFGSTLLWSGTTSTDWQRFDFESLTTSTDFTPFTVASASGVYSEWDDVSVKEVVSETVLNMPFERISDSIYNATKDYSGNDNNGTEIAGVLWNATGGFDGKGAYEFDGDDDYIITTSDDFKTPNATWSAWVKREGATTYHVVMSLSTSALNRFYLSYRNTDDFYLTDDIENEAQGNAITSSALPINTWSHIAVVFYENGSKYLYQDGVYKGADDDGSNLTGIDAGASFWVGAENLAWLWNGTIDDVAVYNRSLSTEQITAIYENRTDIMTASETSPGDYYSVCVTPNDGTQDGTEVCSSPNITIQSAPVISNVVLNSTLGTNLTTENLTVYWDATDADSDDVKNITNWKLDGASIALLNMPFEDSSGNRSGDYSGNENNGTTNTATWNATGGYDGKGAYQFDGVDDYISITSDDFMTGSATWSMWLKKEDTTTDYFISYRNSASSQYTMYTDATGDIKTTDAINGTSQSFTVQTDNLHDGDWHNVVVVFANNGSKSFYADGVLEDEIDNDGDNLSGMTSPAIMTIGILTAGNALVWNGAIDNVMIYNRSLSAEQITALYENRTNIMTASETSPGDYYSVCVTPNDGTQDGTEVCSSPNITIQSAPVVSNVVLNSTLGTNLTSENLTVYWDDTDADGDDVKNITNWKLNGTSIAVLNMPFEDSSGNRSGDYSGNENNASTNTATWNATEGYDSKGAYGFDGIDDYILVPDDASFSLTNNMSYGMWVKTNDLTATGTLFRNGAYSYQLLILAGETPWCYFNNGSNIIAKASGISIGAWHYVTCVVNSTTASVFVDGVLEQNVSFSGPLINTGDLLIGGTAVGYFNGTIDDIQIFNRSLTPEQVTTLYENKSYIMTASETAKADNWTACITPNDGVQDGIEVCSDIIVENTPPETIQVDLNASSLNNYSTDDLVCLAQFADNDSEVVYANYTWYKDGAVHSTGQTSTTFTLGSLVNIVNLSSANTAAGESWICQVEAYDGTDYEGKGTNSSGLTIVAAPTTTTTTTTTVPPYYLGGGGGGSSNTRTSYSEWFDLVEKGKPVTVNVPQLEGIEKVEFELTDDLEKQWLLVKKAAAPPGEFPKTWYNVFKIDSDKITDYLKTAKIYFNVNKNWLNEQGLDRFDITLHRWAGYYWQELPIVFRGVDNNYVRYMATTNRFSYFLVGEKEIDLPGVKEILEMEKPTEGVPSVAKQTAVDALISAEETLKHALDLKVNVKEAEKKMAQAQEAYLQGNYQQALTLAKEAKLLAEEVMPEVEKPVSLLEIIFGKAYSSFDKAITTGKLISDRIKPSLKNYGQYWLVGVTTLIIIIVGFSLVVIKIKRPSKVKKKKVKLITSKHKPGKKAIKKRKIKNKFKVKFKEKFKEISPKKIAIFAIISTLFLSLLIGGPYFLTKYYATQLTSFGRHIFSLASSVGKKVLPFIVETSKTFGSFVMGVGKIILSKLSFTGSFVTEIKETITHLSFWLPFILTLLIIVGMLIYLFGNKRKNKKP